jgi:hypothetical protein
MASDSLGAAKLRVLREAVRRNVEAPRRVPAEARAGFPARPLPSGWPGAC